MKTFCKIILALSLVTAAYAAEKAVTALHGAIEKVDADTRTIVVKSDDGLRHTLHVLDSTAVHGADAAENATTQTWHGLKEGGEVVVHYTKRGAEDTAVEIDKVGEDGLRTTEGTVKEIDRSGKKLVVVASDGTEEDFRLTEHASKDAGKDIAKETEKGTKVTVYYTEDAGKKVAHFFKVL